MLLRDRACSSASLGLSAPGIFLQGGVVGKDVLVTLQLCSLKNIHVQRPGGNYCPSACHCGLRMGYPFG